MWVGDAAKCLGHNMAVEYINSKQLQLPIQVKFRTELDKHSIIDWDRPPMVEELLGVDGLWGKKSHFSLGMCPLIGSKGPSE